METPLFLLSLYSTVLVGDLMENRLPQVACTDESGLANAAIDLSDIGRCQERTSVVSLHLQSRLKLSV